MAYDIGPVIGIEGEKEFRDAIKQINTTMKTLATEMNAATSAFDKNDKSAKALTAQNSVLNKQIEAQNQKLAELKRGLAAAAEKYGENDKVTQGWKQAVNQATAGLNKMEGQLKENNLAMDGAAEKTKRLEQAHKDLDHALSGVKKSAGNAVKVVAGMATGLALAATAVVGFAMKASDNADEIQRLSDVTGLSSERIQELTYVGKNLGVELDTITGAQAKLTKAMAAAGKETGDQAEAFKRLRVDAFDPATGAMRDSKVIMREVIDALNGVGNETERDTLAMILFGKSAMELNPLIKAGGNELNRLAEEAHKSGAVLSGDTVAALDAFGDTIDSAKQSVIGLAGNVVSQLLPTLQPLADKIKNIDTKPIVDGFKWLLDNGDKITSVIVGIGAGMVAWNVGTMIQGVVSAIKAWKIANEGLIVSQGILNAALAANPIGIVAVAIGALVAGIMLLVSANKKAVDDMTNRLVEGYVIQKNAALKSIDAQHKKRTESLDRQMDFEGKASADRLKIIKDEYDQEIKEANKKEQSLKKNLQERQAALDKAHNDAIKQIQDEYGIFEKKQKSKTQVVQDEANTQKDIVSEVLNLSKDIAAQEGDAFSKTYDAILSKAQDIHDKKIAMYQKEYLKSVSLINQDLAAKVKGFKDEIDKIEGKTKEEDRIAKEQADGQKILDLQAKVDSAENDANRKEANIDLANEINRQNREKELENRRIQTESLNTQIQTAIAKANEDKQNTLKALTDRVGKQQIIIDAATQHTIDQIQAERKSKEDAENKKYNAAKKSLDKQESALDGFAERYKVYLDAELKKKQNTEAAKLKAAQDRINDEIKLEQDLAEKKKADVEKAAKVKIDTSKLEALQAEYSRLTKLQWWQKTGQDLLKVALLAKQIEDEKKRLRDEGVPGFATGVQNFVGGRAIVGEKGPELVNLPRGSDVIPLDDTARVISYALKLLTGKVGSNNIQTRDFNSASEVKHTGTIRVEGVNDEKQLMSVVEILIEDSLPRMLRREVRMT